MAVCTADIAVKGDFQATEVEFEAVTPKGMQAMQQMGGGFACIGMTVRKSYAGDYIDRFRELGCIVELPV
jgi:hypothetical protein